VLQGTAGRHFCDACTLTRLTEAIWNNAQYTRQGREAISDNERN
jgi:hypothetical protein